MTNISEADNLPSNQLKTVSRSDVGNDSGSGKPSKDKGSLKDSKGVQK